MDTINPTIELQQAKHMMTIWLYKWVSKPYYTSTPPYLSDVSKGVDSSAHDQLRATTSTIPSYLLHSQGGR